MGGFHTLVNLLWLHSSSVMVCARFDLDFVGMLVSRIDNGSGVGFRPSVVHPSGDFACNSGRSWDNISNQTVANRSDRIGLYAN